MNKNIFFLFLIFLSTIQANSQEHPVILINTDMGCIKIELYPEKAPVTVNNFLYYVDENMFANASFYRTVTLSNQPDNKVKIEVIQGGLYYTRNIDSMPCIMHETTQQTGILHKDGVISMARNQPGTASTEFFICVGDQPELDFQGKRNPDGQGFAAFGKVIEGMEVVKKIHQLPEKEQSLSPRIKIIEIRRLGK